MRPRGTVVITTPPTRAGKPMKILTFSQRVTVQTSHGTHRVDVICNPGERLIFDDDNAFAIQQNPSSSSYILESSDLEPILRQVPRPPYWKKRRVLFYRNRGIGDQLIASSLSRFWREMLGADARQLSDRVHEPIWAGNPYIGNMPLSAPIHLDSVWRAKGRPFFDAAFFIESVTEWDSDGEQGNVYDRLFALAGIDPNRVAAKYKRPFFSVTAEDIERCNTWLTGIGIGQAPYIFVQLRAANKVRSLPLKTAQTLLQAVTEAAAKLACKVVVTDNQPLPIELAEFCRVNSLYDASTKIPGVRLYGSLIAQARLVIGPDSSALHFAAASETPAIGIWGPFNPESRTQYYPRQTHLWHRDLCQSSPCYNFMPELPIQKCPRGAAQQHCECFDGVTYDEVYSAIIDGT